MIAALRGHRTDRPRRPKGPHAVAPGWQERQEAAGTLVAAAHDAAIPTIEEHPGIAVFGGLDGALRYLHDLWVTYLGVALDETLDDSSGDLPIALRAAWVHVGAEYRSLAKVLCHYADHPVVQEAGAAHRQLLHDASGINVVDLPRFESLPLPESPGRSTSLVMAGG